MPIRDEARDPLGFHKALKAKKRSRLGKGIMLGFSPFSIVIAAGTLALNWPAEDARPANGAQNSQGLFQQANSPADRYLRES